MAELASALPYIAAASTVLGVAATIQQGKNQQTMAEIAAREREKDANAALAESQRESIIERRKAKNLVSRARAIAGASGAGSSDPTVTEILSDIDTQGEVNALNALHSGKTLAQGLRSGAATARREGRAARTASYVDAASITMSGASSWYSKYGGKKPPASEVDYVYPTVKRK